MKFISFATGVVCATLLATTGSAQTGSGSTNAQTSGSLQAEQRKATVETKQDAKVGERPEVCGSVVLDQLRAASLLHEPLHHDLPIDGAPR